MMLTTHGAARVADSPAATSAAHEAGVLAPAASSASVALDLGPGQGALVIYPGERFRGREIEISRHGGDGGRVHTGVHERRSHRGSLLTAIFGSLPAGEYAVWEDAETAAGTVAVAEESVAEFHLP
jgi:hypothetical protein